jgi:hypothetical protein
MLIMLFGTLMPIPKHQSVIATFLASQSSPVDATQIYALFTVGEATVKKYLREYLAANPDDIPRIVGFYPSAETIIALAEKKIGITSGRNLFEINQQCKEIVDSITKPKHRRFVESMLINHVAADKKTIHILQSELVDLLYEQYVNFVHEADNGLVSIAGTMNEKILVRALENAGLKKDSDFKKTGKDSEGDLQIEYRGRTTKIMFCEVKSYAARERLLRGLQDIRQPEKVGVGFFNDATEFNPDRTKTLLAASPLAIYMPDVTLNQVATASKVQTTRNQDRLYRPLSMYVDDMVAFKNTGSISTYR